MCYGINCTSLCLLHLQRILWKRLGSRPKSHVSTHGQALVQGLLLQPLRWRCVKCVIHHKRNVREEKHHIYVAQTSNDKVISSGDLYCCLLPQWEALCTCRLSFLTATKWCCDQDVKVVPDAAFTQRMCNRCGWLYKGGDVFATCLVVLR